MKLSMLYIAPIFAAAMLLAGCINPKTEFKGYDGPTLANEELAIIDNEPWGCIGCFRPIALFFEDGKIGRKKLYKENEQTTRIDPIKLLPGKYKIIGSHKGHKTKRVHLSAAVTLKAGHRYSFHEEWCSGLISLYDCKGYTSNLYFQDDTTGEVIARKKWSTYLQK
jgi:hypothetical protein